MDNNTEILKRVKLLMEYDMSKTYSENISVISEQNKKATDEDWKKYPCVVKWGANKINDPKQGVVYKDETLWYLVSGTAIRIADNKKQQKYTCDGDSIKIDGDLIGTKCVKGNCSNGQGTRIYTDGMKMEGYFKDGSWISGNQIYNDGTKTMAYNKNTGVGYYHNKNGKIIKIKRDGDKVFKIGQDGKPISTTWDELDSLTPYGQNANVKATDEDWKKYPCVVKWAKKIDDPKHGITYTDDVYAYFANGRVSDGQKMLGYNCDGDKIIIDGTIVANNKPKKPPYIWKDSPFRNQQEGDLFRQWMNTNYPEFSKSIRLDPKGRYNNAYIEKAWKSKGKESGKTYGELYRSDIEITPSSPKSASGQLQANTEPLNAQPQSVQPVSTANLTPTQTTKKEDRQYNRFVRQQERQPKSATRYEG